VSCELVIFDCDGVLVDSEAIVIQIESGLLTAAGFPVTADEIADRFVGLSYPDMMATLESEFGRPVPAELSTRIQRDALAAFPDQLRPVAGMRDLLHGLAPQRCVASSSDLDRIQLSLEVTGLQAYFEPEHLFSAQMVDNGKPAPDLFVHAAGRLGARAEDCLVIEDSPHGILAAIAAGMRVIGFVGGLHARPSLRARLEAAGAETIVDHPGQISDQL